MPWDIFRQVSFANLRMVCPESHALDSEHLVTSHGLDISEMSLDVLESSPAPRLQDIGALWDVVEADKGGNAERDRERERDYVMFGFVKAVALDTGGPMYSSPGDVFIPSLQKDVIWRLPPNAFYMLIVNILL